MENRSYFNKTKTKNGKFINQFGIFIETCSKADRVREINAKNFAMKIIIWGTVGPSGQVFQAR